MKPKFNNIPRYFFKDLGTSITIDLNEGHTVFVSARYDHEHEYYNLHMAICVTPSMRTETEEDSLPIYNVFVKNMQLTSHRNNLKTSIKNKVVEMFNNGELNDAISEIDIIHTVLEHSEDLIDKINLESKSEVIA